MWNESADDSSKTTSTLPTVPQSSMNRSVLRLFGSAEATPAGSISPAKTATRATTIMCRMRSSIPSKWGSSCVQDLVATRVHSRTSPATVEALSRSTGRSFKVIYDDDVPNKVVREEQTASEPSEQRPEDRLMGGHA